MFRYAKGRTVGSRIRGPGRASRMTTWYRLIVGGDLAGQPISTLKARAVLIDTETGVLNSLLSGSLGEIFDSRQLISDQYGAGNNWAQGHMEYGPKYEADILESIRRTAEHCDSLQSFFLLHSLGGGTGSGLGTYVLSLLADHYPDVYRFTNSVFPSEDDDVVTSPYNSALALHQLSEHADCVLPTDNRALAEICRRVQEGAAGGKRGSAAQDTSAVSEEGAVTAGGVAGKARSFDEMNNVAANMLTHLTSSMRFEGSLNVDLNEVTMNMVPFPRLKYLISSVSPLSNFHARGSDGSSFSVDAMFSSAFHKDTQLMRVEPKNSTYLACALLARGDVPISDLHRNVERLKKSVRMVHWNPDGFKIGLCNTPPIHQSKALLCLANSCCIAQTFSTFRDRFQKLYKRKAMVHHYEKFMGGNKEAKEQLDMAAENMNVLIEEYERLDNLGPPGMQACPRMTPAI
mmetsp:Transcript_13598/g.21240  ORF Transcript_13598/g.21240 Transcript_13598/m.21240 type:complete len:460 (-) Transcript_13598:203-1582(-)